MKRGKVSIKKSIKRRLAIKLNGNNKPKRIVKERDNIRRGESIPVKLLNNDFLDIRPTKYSIESYVDLFSQDSSIIKILFLISNFERKEMLEELLVEIKNVDIENVIIDYRIYDDVSSYKLNDTNFVINPEHRGKFDYWKTWNDMFGYCKDNLYDIYVFSPNDFQNYNFNEIIKYGMKLSNHKYIFNTLTDERTMSWNNIPPIQITDDVRLQFFSDCGFFTNYETLKSLDFKMTPISTNNPKMSSQVGKQITNRINNLKIPTFTTLKSIVSHGKHLSLMNPSEDRTNTLTPLNLI